LRIINIRSVGVLLAVLAVGALAVLVTDHALAVALAVLLRAASLFAVAPLAQELAPEGQVGLHDHLIDGLCSNLAELHRVLAAFTVAVDAE
jgi:hypothetical protein